MGFIPEVQARTYITLIGLAMARQTKQLQRGLYRIQRSGQKLSCETLRGEWETVSRILCEDVLEISYKDFCRLATKGYSAEDIFLRCQDLQVSSTPKDFPKKSLLELLKNALISPHDRNSRVARALTLYSTHVSPIRKSEIFESDLAFRKALDLLKIENHEIVRTYADFQKFKRYINFCFNGRKFLHSISLNGETRCIEFGLERNGIDAISTELEIRDKERNPQRINLRWHDKTFKVVADDGSYGIDGKGFTWLAPRKDVAIEAVTYKGQTLRIDANSVEIIGSFPLAKSAIKFSLQTASHFQQRQINFIWDFESSRWELAETKEVESLVDTALSKQQSIASIDSFVRVYGLEGLYQVRKIIRLENTFYVLEKKRISFINPANNAYKRHDLITVQANICKQIEV